MKDRAVALILVMLLAVANRARRKNGAVTSVGAETEEEQLAREVDDPSTILMLLKFQDI